MPPPNPWRWIHTGDEAFASLVAALDNARESVALETYIYTDTDPGRRLRDALTRAAHRKVSVRVLIDAFGSLYLTDEFWQPLRSAGGVVRWFNPLSLHRFNIRDHRKLLLVDDHYAFLGGFNIDQAWTGDGVTRGWRDLGLEIRGSLAPGLRRSFDVLFHRADFRHRRPAGLRSRANLAEIPTPQGLILAAGPGRHRHPIRRHLRRDLSRATEVRIIAAYFLPPLRLLRAILRVARRGGSVELILPAHSDVSLMHAATRGLYGRLLRAGVRLFEYQPQILHTKFVQIDAALYLGSANLERRSLGINYDFLVRFDQPALLQESREVFEQYRRLAAPIDRPTWLRTHTRWERLKEWAASVLFARIDPYLTRYQLRDWS